MGYIPLYGLDNAVTFVRTTLRHPDFIYGWKNIVDIKLTDDSIVYNTDAISLADFFKAHFDKHGFSGWLEKKMMERFSQTKEILERLMQFMEVEQAASEEGKGSPENILMVDGKGNLENIDLGEVKDKAAAMVAYKMHEANLTLKQLFFLGMDDQETMIARGRYSAADMLEIALQKKLPLQPHEHDMVVMMHEIEFELNGQRTMLNSSFSMKGTDEHSANDAVTGLMLGIAATSVLNGSIAMKGLHIPVMPEIYEPVLQGLQANGVAFRSEHRSL